MGSQLSDIKKGIKKKSTLASLLVIPAVVAGLGLLGLQTYSLITGKSFGDMDFNIGKLWETEDNLQLPKDDTESISYLQPLIKQLTEEQVLNHFDADLAKNILPSIRKKKPVQLTNNKESKKMEKRFEKELFSVETIDQVKLTSLIRGEQFSKYVNRLEQEFLINPNITPQKGKWFVGFSFAPTLNYRTFSYDPTLVNGVAIDGNLRYTFGLTEKQRNISDRSISSYTIGFDFGNMISDKLSVFSGIHYAHYGEQVMVCHADSKNPNFQQASFHGESPSYEVFDEENRTRNLPFKNKYSYIEIPVGLSYQAFEFNKSKISIYAALSLQTLCGVNALIYDFDTDYYYYWMNEKNDVFRRFGIGSQIGLTVSQYVADKTELFINPQFKFNLNSTFKEPYPVSQNQYTTGLRIGFKQHIL